LEETKTVNSAILCVRPIVYEPSQLFKRFHIPNAYYLWPLQVAVFQHIIHLEDATKKNPFGNNLRFSPDLTAQNYCQLSPNSQLNSHKHRKVRH